MAQLRRKPSISKLQTLATDIMCSVARYAHDKDSIGSRKRMIAHAEELLLEARGPLEHLFALSGQMAENAAIRAAIGMGIFDIFPESERLNLAQITNLTGAEMGLVRRIMRVLVASRLSVENSDRTYSLSRVGKYLKVAKYQSLFIFQFDCHMPSLTKLPEYLAKTGWKNPTNATDTPFHRGHGTNKSMFEYYAQDSNLLQHFNNSLATVEDMDVYNAILQTPWPAILGPVPALGVALVDVGGASGNVLQQILTKHPDLTGRFVLQDLPDTIEKVPRDLNPRIEVMSYDFFTPQPIKGARAYHYRMVFHDWPLEECRQILRQLKPAMAPGYSKLLIGDLIIPDVGASRTEAVIDMMMMTFAAEEKSESTFSTLLESEGFSIRNIWRSESGRDGIIEAVLLNRGTAEVGA